MSREAFEKWWLKNYDGCGVNPNGKWKSKEEFWADRAWQAAQTEMQQQLLKAQAQVEVMREALKEGLLACRAIGHNIGEVAILEALAITPSEALQQYCNEQRALALEDARNKIGVFDKSVYKNLTRWAQEWRDKK